MPSLVRRWTEIRAKLRDSLQVTIKRGQKTVLRTLLSIVMHVGISYDKILIICLHSITTRCRSISTCSSFTFSSSSQFSLLCLSRPSTSHLATKQLQIRSHTLIIRQQKLISPTHYCNRRILHIQLLILR